MNQRIETDLERAVRSLRNQGITITEQHIPPDGSVFFLSPTGIALTRRQLLKLRADGGLDSQEIKIFAAQEESLLEEDVESVKGRVPQKQLRSWTATEICDYINEEFGRVHSIRHVTDALNRLDIEYKRV